MPNNSHNSTPSPNISTGGPTTVQVIEHGRDIHMYKITDIELDVLKSSSESLSSGFWQLCLGIFIGFLVPLLTVQLPDMICAIFVAMVFASGLLGLYFGIKWRREKTKTKQHIKQVKERFPS